VPDRQEAYRHKALDDLTQLRRDIMETEMDDARLGAVDTAPVANPTWEGLIEAVAQFSARCGFSPAEFDQLRD
jgi:hypothetical protein